MEQEKKMEMVWEEPELKPVSADSAEGGCAGGTNARAACLAGGIATSTCDSGTAPKKKVS